MQKNSILKFQIFSSIFASILGLLFHFAFEWSNSNLLVAAFSNVNESTWEHLKLAFFPMLLTTIIGYFYIGKNLPNFLCSKTIGIIATMTFITVFFYTYTGILGTNFAFINIASFFVAVLLGEYIAYKLLLAKSPCNNKLVIGILVILLCSFVIFTYFTPQIGLFRDPVTGSFGI